MYVWMDGWIEREAEYSRHIRFTLLVKSKQNPLYRRVYKLSLQGQHLHKTTKHTAR